MKINVSIRDFNKFDRLRLRFAASAEGMVYLAQNEIIRNPFRALCYAPFFPLFPFPMSGLISGIFTVTWIALMPTEYCKNVRKKLSHIFTGEVDNETLLLLSFMIKPEKTRRNCTYKYKLNDAKFTKQIIVNTFWRPLKATISETAHPYISAFQEAREQRKLHAWWRFISCFGFKLHDKALLKPFSKKYKCQQQSCPS